MYLVPQAPQFDRFAPAPRRSVWSDETRTTSGTPELLDVLYPRSKAHRSRTLASTLDASREVRRLIVQLLGVSLEQSFSPQVEDGAREILNEVYGLVADGEEQRALEKISDAILDLLTEGRLDDVNSILREVEVERAQITVLIGVSAFTRSSAVLLSERPAYVARAQAYVNRVTDRQEVDAYIRGVS